MLSGETNAILGTDALTITISEDTDPVSLSVDDAEATEDMAVVFTVEKSAKRGEAVTVDYETSPGEGDAGATSSDDGEGADFTKTMGTLTIAADTKSGTITVPVTDDMLDEVDAETFTLTLSNPTGGGATLANTTATGTIIDNDNPPAFSVADASAEEGMPVVFTVEASSGALAEMTVDYTITVGPVGEGNYTAAERLRRRRYDDGYADFRCGCNG